MNIVALNEKDSPARVQFIKGERVSSFGRFRFASFAHVANCALASMLLITDGGQGIALGTLRAMFAFSGTMLLFLVWGKRNNALFLARTLILILPGYFAAGVQLWDPKLYYSVYEAVSQTLDISLTMYALSSFALLGSEVGLWLGSRNGGSARVGPALSDDFFFYATIVPFLLVSYYVSLMYGKSLFEASYASVAGLAGIGSSTAIGAILAFVMFQNYLLKPSVSKGIVLTLSLMYFLIFGMLIRGGRQDVLSCLFGLYVIYWGQKKIGAPISLRAAIAGIGLFIFMEYLGYIRSNVLSGGFDYVGYFYEFIGYYFNPNGIVSFGTISPIASTFGNTIYAVKTGITGHIWGAGYWDYILRTPPEFLYPDRPRDYAWIFQDWNLKAGGGFFELAEAYLNFGVVGVILVPMGISFYISRVFTRYLSDGSLLNNFLLFALLSVFLRGALYQTFAFYKAAIASIILMYIFRTLGMLRAGVRLRLPKLNV